MSGSRIIVALDISSARQALDFAGRLDPALCRVKVGKELFTAAGRQLFGELMVLVFGVVLGLKFHDIPSTVAKACEVGGGMWLSMKYVHALGVRRMLSAALEAVPVGSSKVIAVTH